MNSFWQLKKVFLALPLLFAVELFAGEQICSDFECLVQNSFKQYQEDHDHWWKIYNSKADQAKSCIDTKDVKEFLSLWAGDTDGEMLEALHDDTEFIIVKHTDCFFNALDQSESFAQENFFSSWCPLSDFDFHKVLSNVGFAVNHVDLRNKFLKRLNDCLK